jgi:hypothetical protein
MQELEAMPLSVVAGSVMGWGTHVESAFNLIVFLYVPTEVRIQRLESREALRFGKANPTFLAWAAQYDEGLQEGRSLKKHNSWLATRACQVVRLVGSHSVAELLTHVERQMSDPAIEAMRQESHGIASHRKL